MLFYLLTGLFAYAQLQTRLVFTGEALIRNGYSFPQKVQDSSAFINELHLLVDRFRANGYWLASADSVWREGSAIVALVSVGTPFKGIILRTSAAQTPWRAKPFKFKKTAYSFREWEYFKEQMISEASNHGFPFAQIGMDSISLANQLVRGVLDLDTGPVIRWDSVLVQNEGKVKPWFLEKWLQVKIGEPFSSRVARSAERKLQQLPYLKLTTLPQLYFQNGKAQLKLDFTPRAVNEIDALLGVLPNAGTASKTVLTGNVSLELFNPFQSGKHIFFSWQRLKPETQQLSMKYTHPFLLRSDYTVSTQFELLKQDTTFLNLDVRIGVSRMLGGLIRGGFFLRNFSGRQIEQLTEASAPDVRLLSAGLEFSYSDFDDYFFPKKGWKWEIFMEQGSRKLTRNGMQAYRHLLFQGFSRVKKASSLAKRGVLLSSLELGVKHSIGLLQNELFRLGGLLSWRGFNEQQFFATSYFLLSNELRVSAESGTYLFTFVDAGWYKSSDSTSGNRDLPIGFGGGISLMLPAGIFQIVYALGKSNDQRISFQQSKIHFGYKARF